MPTEFPPSRPQTAVAYRGLFKEGNRHRALIGFPMLFGPVVVQHLTGVDGVAVGGIAGAFFAAAYHLHVEGRMNAQGIARDVGSAMIRRKQGLIYAATLFASVAFHGYLNQPAKTPVTPRLQQAQITLYSKL